ncbi:MAG TPA: outer membrane beta-barrel domain-containing protein [Kofleriaceae bacterium]|jgi:outer membrane beta-barrel protein|nr:outer membrane beta-barrel domain-containing protein [Kofleriaceae bacterium]
MKPIATLAVAIALAVGAAGAASADAPTPTRTAAADQTKDPDAVVDERTTAICVDQEIADRLAVKRKRRGAVDRLFVKQSRHELTAGGGYYASDLFSGTWVIGGAYTYHMTDQTAVEFGGGMTHANADVVRAIEDQRGQVLDDDFARVLYAESLLLWSPVYGKLRLGGSIAHFDLHLDLGVGAVDSSTSRGAMGVAGFGMKLFVGRAVAFRLDARNRVYRQELLDERFLVNDAAVTLGFSLFLPFRN